MPRFPVRLLIITFWVLLIFSVLYLPNLSFLPFTKNRIHIFSWGDILDPAVIARFEQKTGIKVRVNYYSSNEELLVKLKATKGEGYDLIIPSDYAVQILEKEGLLKDIDRSKLNFWQHINPLLLGHSFDPDNRVSIPFEWEIFCLGIDKDYFAHRELDPSWEMIFNPQYPYRITMVNDPIEAIMFASFYLYGPLNTLNPGQVEGITNLLIRQKRWIEAYANFRGDYFLATRNCPVVIASSSYIWRTMQKFPFVSFVVPKEGTFITIENICLPKASKKDDLVYKFINYLFEPESVANHFQLYGFFPSTTHALDQIDVDPKIKSLIMSTERDFAKYHFTQLLLPDQKTRDLWVDVKTGS